MEEDKKHTEQEAKVTDAVHDKGLLSGIIVCFILKPETNQQIGTKSDAFPSDKHHQVVTTHDEQQHEFRKDLKKMRYSLEFVPKTVMMKPFVAELKRLQEALDMYVGALSRL